MQNITSRLSRLTNIASHFVQLPRNAMYRCVLFCTFLICGTAGTFLDLSQDSKENDGWTGLRPLSLGTAETNRNAQNVQHRRLRDQAKAIAEASNRERLIYIELLKLEDAKEESSKLKEELSTLKKENERLRVEVSIILAGIMVEKLEQKYGTQFGNVDRGERWALMMDLNDPPMSFLSKKANDEGVGKDGLAEIIKKIMRIRNENVHDRILERNYFKICVKFHKDAPECVHWMVSVLEEAYGIMLRETKLRENELKETENKRESPNTTEKN